LDFIVCWICTCYCLKFELQIVGAGKLLCAVLACRQNAIPLNTTLRCASREQHAGKRTSGCVRQRENGVADGIKIQFRSGLFACI
jgi:hypothetical protein